jgi:hypothetical protein
MTVEMPNSYGCFLLGDLLKENSSQNMWSHTWNICTAADAVDDTVDEKPVTKKQKPSEEQLEPEESAPSAASASSRQKTVLPPPPPPPDAKAEPDDDALEKKKLNTKGLSDRDWWVINQHQLDKEAVRALSHLAEQAPEAKDTFVDKLVLKLDKGDLRKPSNFVITCVRNALAGGAADM